MTSAPPADSTTTTQYISFLLTEKMRGMIPTTQLSETINLELNRIVQIPDLPPAVVGVCGWRGEVLWLVDLSYALSLTPLLDTDYQSAKCSVLRVTVHQQSFGILVADVQQLVRGDRQKILPGLPSRIKPEAAPIIAGQFPDSQGNILISIDLEGLLESLRPRT
jgi:positive phototaxis protein PixI